MIKYKLKQPINIEDDIIDELNLKEKKDIKFYQFTGSINYNNPDDITPIIGYMSGLSTKQINDIGFDDGIYLNKYLTKFNGLIEKALSEDTGK
tara:strand:- start:1648 stop:1926 length:279 start_codon:yes stop_codon:yes gene_type:complete